MKTIRIRLNERDLQHVEKLRDELQGSFISCFSSGAITTSDIMRSVVLLGCTTLGYGLMHQVEIDPTESFTLNCPVWLHKRVGFEAMGAGMGKGAYASRAFKRGLKMCATGEQLLKRLINDND